MPIWKEAVGKGRKEDQTKNQLLHRPFVHKNITVIHIGLREKNDGFGSSEDGFVGTQYILMLELVEI